MCRNMFGIDKLFYILIKIYNYCNNISYNLYEIIFQYVKVIYMYCIYYFVIRYSLQYK